MENCQKSQRIFINLEARALATPDAFFLCKLQGDYENCHFQKSGTVVKSKPSFEFKDAKLLQKLMQVRQVAVFLYHSKFILGHTH